MMSMSLGAISSLEELQCYPVSKPYRYSALSLMELEMNPGIDIYLFKTFLHALPN